MKNSFLLVMLLTFSSPSVHALSLVYEGFLCQLGSYERSQWVGQSRMEVLSYKGDGIYELEITGGIINIDNDPCIDTNLSTIKSSGQPFKPAQTVTATAYFDGVTLVITVSRYTSVLNADVFPNQYQYISSIVHTNNQYYFDYDENRAFFILRNAVTQTDGFVQSFTGMESLNPFLVNQRPNEPVILRLVDY